MGEMGINSDRCTKHMNEEASTPSYHKSPMKGWRTHSAILHLKSLRKNSSVTKLGTLILKGKWETPWCDLKMTSQTSSLICHYYNPKALNAPTP